ncbi:hypothetical protein EJB05_13929 [Eragrostis curvula]|uniref:FBD domain-containing protein n=1 Tax=Eragrostis curvula TaxID=38414 RepID=A0A5J9VXN6_9POAL|nr:hypothetical protein EJB05_13929 [Eragrostis curvula]
MDAYDPSYVHLGNLGQLKRLVPSVIMVYGNHHSGCNREVLRFLKHFQVIHNLNVVLCYPQIQPRVRVGHRCPRRAVAMAWRWALQLRLDMFLGVVVLNSTLPLPPHLAHGEDLVDFLKADQRPLKSSHLFSMNSFRGKLMRAEDIIANSTERGGTCGLPMLLLLSKGYLVMMESRMDLNIRLRFLSYCKKKKLETTVMKWQHDDMDNFQYLMEDITHLPRVKFLTMHVINEGHAFGASSCHVLRLCTGIRKLSLVLLTSRNLEAQLTYPSDCICDQPTNWKIEKLSLSLQEVEITGLKGAENEQLNVDAPLLNLFLLRHCLTRDQPQPIANISAPRLITLVWMDVYDPSYVHLGNLGQLQQLGPNVIVVYGNHHSGHNREVLRFLQHFQIIHKLKIVLGYPQGDIGNFQYLMEDITRLPHVTFLTLLVMNEGHAFGASSFHVLRLCTGIRKLSLVLLPSCNSEVKQYPK